MLKSPNILVLLLSLTLFAFLPAKAQNGINAPYSGFGIGLLSNISNGTMASMGGVAYAMQSPYFINYKNPASYSAFDSLSFIADASLSIVTGNLKTSSMTQKSSFARANYLMIGLPVTKHWRTSVGVVPFSDIGYKIIDRQDETVYHYNGDGGLIQLYWGNAFKIAKNLSIGLNTSYLFGSLYNTRHIYINTENSLNNSIFQNTYVDGIYLSGGIQYFIDINKDHRLGLGVIYENSAYIWAKENLLITHFADLTTSNQIYDTVLCHIGEKGRMIIPQSIGGGITYSLKNKLLLGFDVTWQNWSKYRLMDRSDSLKNNILFSAGLQFTPDASSNKYFRRISLRAGGKYSSGYLVMNDLPISEYAFTLGIGLPVKTFSSQSTINIMLEYGRMGTVANNLIMQDYFKISLNFILQEKWYQRTKLE